MNNACMVTFRSEFQKIAGSHALYFPHYLHFSDVRK